MIVKVFFVQCDECHEFLDDQNEFETRQEARESAENFGWTVVSDSEIICDKCKAAN